MNRLEFWKAIKEAARVYVWVRAFKEDGIYVRISKQEARLLCSREQGFGDIEADVRADGLYIN